MAGTRSSTQSNDNASSLADSNKRKAEDSPNAAKDTKLAKTEDGQQTLDEAFGNGDKAHVGPKDESEHKNSIAGVSGDADHRVEVDSEEGADKKDNTSKNGTTKANDNTTENAKSGPTEPEPSAANDGAIETSKAREEALPSNVLEKGIIYFFTRGRVGIEDIESVTDLQRSYFVLRPLPDGAKIGDGAMDDLKNNRLIAIPKKVWPKSGKDRFMAFVESAQNTNKELKETFFQGSEYETKTVGTRHTPPVTPIGEGVYAITSTGDRGETHLAYMLTVPQEPGKVQEDVGIRSKGSFLLSLKNPEVKGPANASLPQKPDFPKEFIDDFRNRSWMPVAPKHLDYANAQMLMIGEDFESSHALDQSKKDQGDDKKESPEEALEELENEDQIRISHLKGDDTIFADLGISKKDYPDVATTW